MRRLGAVILGLCIMVAGVALLGCSDATVYTLYRNSVRTRDCMSRRSIQPTASHTAARTAKQLVTCFSSSRASRRSFGARKEDFASDLPSTAIDTAGGEGARAEEDWGRR